MRLKSFPRYELTFGPSPVHPLKRLSQHLGGAQILGQARRRQTGALAYGGNKIRKLEYIVPDVLASGADTLVSIGGYPNFLPHPPGCGCCCASRAEMSPRAGSGSRGTTRSTTRSETSCSRA